MSLKEKLQEVVDIEIKYAKKNGSTRLSTCNHPNWDQDIYNHRHEIIDAIRSAGYTVVTSVNHGVLDIETIDNIINSKA